MKQLDYQEQAFVSYYLDGSEPFNAYKAAIAAGYAETTARVNAGAWVSVTRCPPHKLHVREAVQNEIERRFAVEKLDSNWILRRAKLLAEFSIEKFIKVIGNDAVYDFSTATEDDWYCIEEYTTEQIYRKMEGYTVPVDKIKIKAPSKVAALKLLGEHIAIQAFKQNVEHTGTVTNVNMNVDEYKQARSEMLKEDDC